MGPTIHERQLQEDKNVQNAEERKQVASQETVINNLFNNLTIKNCQIPIFFKKALLAGNISLFIYSKTLVYHELTYLPDFFLLLFLL